MAAKQIQLWEYDPTHLDAQEIAFELKIRGIEHFADSTKRDQTTILRKILQKERAGETANINVQELDPITEIDICNKAAASLKHSIVKALQCRDEGQLDLLKSKSAFYFNRINLVENQSLPLHSETLVIFEEIKGLLTGTRSKTSKKQVSEPLLGLPSPDDPTNLFLQRQNQSLNSPTRSLGRGRGIPIQVISTNENFPNKLISLCQSDDNIESDGGRNLSPINNQVYENVEKELSKLTDQEITNLLKDRIEKIALNSDSNKQAGRPTQKENRIISPRPTKTMTSYEVTQPAFERYDRVRRSDRTYSKRPVSENCLVDRYSSEEELEDQNRPIFPNQNHNVSRWEESNVRDRNVGENVYQSRPRHVHFQQPRQALEQPLRGSNINARHIPQPNGNLVKKWGFTFSGDGQGYSLGDFLSKIELNARSERVTNEQLFNSIHYLLSGEAEKWYRSNFDEFRCWDEVVMAMRAHFLPRNYSYLLLDEISNRLQGRTESFAHYFTDMKLLFQRAYPPLDENYKIYIVLKNMLPEHSAQVCNFNFETLNQLIYYCKRLDENRLMNDRRMASTQFTPRILMEPACFLRNQTSYREGPRNFQPNRMHNVSQNIRVAEIQEFSVPQDQDQYIALNEAVEDYVNHRADDRQNYERVPEQEMHPQVAQLEAVTNKCWNCEETGHSFRDCPKPKLRIFCFHCGKVGQTIRLCNHPTPGNVEINQSNRPSRPLRVSGNDRREGQTNTRALP